jgi:hypothetical protein
VEVLVEVLQLWQAVYVDCKQIKSQKAVNSLGLLGVILVDQ